MSWFNKKKKKIERAIDYENYMTLNELTKCKKSDKVRVINIEGLYLRTNEYLCTLNKIYEVQEVFDKFIYIIDDFGNSRNILYWRLKKIT